MNIKYATEFAREFIKNHPEHKGEVLDYYSLMKDEISEGGSTDHEIGLFIGSCNDLLTKDNLAKDGVEINNEKDKEDEKGTLTEDGKKLLIAEFQDVKDDTKRRFKFIKDHPEVLKYLKYLLEDGGGVYKGGGGVGKMYYHIIEYGQYDNIGYQGYYDTIEEAQKQVEKLSNYFPNQTFEIFADKSRKEPPITTMHNGGGVKQNSLMSMTKYYVMDANKGELVSKGFNTIEAAKVEMYKMFQETGNKFLVTKTINKGKDEYWERRENLEMFLNLNDEDIYWKWVNGELTDAMAVELIEETQGVKFDTTKKYYNGGFVGKGELVWRKLTDSKKAQFLYENFTPQITPRTQEILTGKTFQFLPKIVKMKIESEYANVEQFAKGNTVKDKYRLTQQEVLDRGEINDSWSSDDGGSNQSEDLEIIFEDKTYLIIVEFGERKKAKYPNMKATPIDLHDLVWSIKDSGEVKIPKTFSRKEVEKEINSFNDSNNEWTISTRELIETNEHWIIIGWDETEMYAKGNTIESGKKKVKLYYNKDRNSSTSGVSTKYEDFLLVSEDVINNPVKDKGFLDNGFYQYPNTEISPVPILVLQKNERSGNQYAVPLRNFLAGDIMEMGGNYVGEYFLGAIPLHDRRNVSGGDADDYESYNQGTPRYAKGGGVGDENREMVLNNNKQIRHHTEELHQILKKDKAEVPAWVVSKVGRATTDLSDATHYLEGSIEKAANGMKIGTGRAGKSLMVMDYKIWDKLNIESGSQLYDDKELQKRYAKEIKMGIEKLGYDQLNEKAFDYLENWNYHALNSALTYMGYYGLERLNRTLDFNKEMMKINRNNYGLDPNIFIGELENKDPKYFIGVEDMKSMMKSLYTYNYGEVDKNDKYLLDYQEKLGKSLFDKTYNEELKRLQEYEIESNVFTDSEGLTYNSLKKKMAEKGTNIGGVSKYKKGGPVKDYTGTDFSKLIDDLKVFLIKYPYIWKKDGKSYVPIEGWQFAAALMGYTTRVVSVNEIENGYMSMAEVIDQDGKVVGSGFGLVTKDEAKWANSQKYELASFSQTRAVSRALRNCISWVIKAAGYKTTPAEEMYGVGSSKMQNMPKYNAPATPKTIVQYPSMTPIKAPMTPPMTTEAPMPDAFEEMADMLRPQKSPMAKNPDFKYKDILRDLYSHAVAYSIVLISPKFMSDVEESLLVDDNDLHYTMLERAYLYLLDNNIVLKTTRYMAKLRKIVNGENFAYGGLLKELPIEIYNAIVESGHQNDIISFDIEPFNSDGDRDKTINVEGVDYYISTKINSEEIANDLNNNTSLNHNYYIADIGGNELLISNN